MKGATALIWFSLMAAPAARADFILVLADSTGDYVTIQEAVDAAQEGDTILVGSGVYTGEGNRDITLSGKNITIDGLEFRSPLVEPVVIDCEGAGRAFDFGPGVGPATVITDFTFLNGAAAGAEGGIMRCDHAGPTIYDCEFYGGAAGSGGAIAAIGDPAPDVSRCIFGYNTADLGGAVAITSGSARIDSSSFYGNSATEGGALHFYDSTASLDDCTIAENIAASSGSAIDLESSSATIEMCIVAFNRGASAIDGGAGSTTSYSCVFGNAGGDSLEGIHHDNLFEDPLLCNVYDDDHTLCANSPCLPEHNAWGVLIGCSPAGCAECESPVESLSWGRLKALYR